MKDEPSLSRDQSHPSRELVSDVLREHESGRLDLAVNDKCEFYELLAMEMLPDWHAYTTMALNVGWALVFGSTALAQCFRSHTVTPLLIIPAFAIAFMAAKFVPASPFFIAVGISIIVSLTWKYGTTWVVSVTWLFAALGLYLLASLCHRNSRWLARVNVKRAALGADRWLLLLHRLDAIRITPGRFANTGTLLLLEKLRSFELTEPDYPERCRRLVRLAKGRMSS